MGSPLDAGDDGGPSLDSGDARDAGDAGDDPAARVGRSKLAAGGSHTCAVWADRGVRCWGANDRGQLGDGTTTSRPEPAAVVGLDDVIEVSAGVSHTCALLVDGSVRCWGYDDRGQLGDGEPGDLETLAVAVIGIDDAVQIAAGPWHTCALLGDGTVQCWGWNEDSELGDGTITQSATPVVVSGLDDVTEVTAGRGFTCARMADATVRCWGRVLAVVNPDGSVPVIATPTTVAGLEGVLEVEAGYDHVCARIGDGSARTERVWCWGWNANRALGGYGSLPQETPVEFLLPSGIAHRDVVELAAGSDDTCVRLDDGRVLCTAERVEIVEGVASAEEIAVGLHACARLVDGTFRCWGGTNAHGQTMAGGCCHDGLCGVPEGVACGADGGTCASLWCSGCGGEGQPCCDRARIGRERCRDERLLCTDTDETCVACGGLGQPCCDGSAEGGARCADASAVCFRDTCVEPGRPGAPCLDDGACEGDGCCVLDGYSVRVCVAPGSPCPGPTGAPPRACEVGGSCSGCGASGEPCCTSEEGTRVPWYCSAPDVSCGASALCE